MFCLYLFKLNINKSFLLCIVTIFTNKLPLVSQIDNKTQIKTMQSEKTSQQQTNDNM